MIRRPSANLDTALRTQHSNSSSCITTYIPYKLYNASTYSHHLSDLIHNQPIRHSRLWVQKLKGPFHPPNCLRNPRTSPQPNCTHTSPPGHQQQQITPFQCRPFRNSSFCFLSSSTRPSTPSSTSCRIRATEGFFHPFRGKTLRGLATKV